MTNTVTLTLNQNNLRGEIEVLHPENGYPENPAGAILRKIGEAVDALVAEHDPEDLENGEIPQRYAADVTLAYDPDKDTCLVDMSFSPAIETDDLLFVPDSYQMVSFLITSWLETIGAITAAGEVNEDYLLAEPTATVH